MKLGRIIGRVVSTNKLDCFEGVKLLLIQPVDRDMQAAGDVVVGMDVVRAGEGDLIFYESSKEAGRALPNWWHPGDVAIMGIIDDIEDIREWGQAR